MKKETLVDGARKCGSAKLELVGDHTDVKNIYSEDDFDKKQIYPQNYGETIEQTLEKKPMAWRKMGDDRGK